MILKLVNYYNSAGLSRSKVDGLLQTDANFIEEIIFPERHLRENISKLEFGQQVSKQLGQNDFKHILDLKIFVKKRN